MPGEEERKIEIGSRDFGFLKDKSRFSIRHDGAFSLSTPRRRQSGCRDWERLKG